MVTTDRQWEYYGLNRRVTKEFQANGEKLHIHSKSESVEISILHDLKKSFREFDIHRAYWQKERNGD